MKNKILIIPSWYSTPEAPTSGSFFHEQSLLLENPQISYQKWEVQVFSFEKNWISRQRNWYYKLFPKKIPLVYTNQYLEPPRGKIIHYPFCKFETDKKNLEREVNAAANYFQKHPSETPDIIHAHCTVNGGIIAHQLAKKLNVPYIITEHLNPFYVDKLSSFWRKEAIDTLENATKVLAVSNYQRQQIVLQEIHCNPIVTGNLVDDERFSIPIEPKINDDLCFLIVTFYPNFIKDMDTLFEAIKHLKESDRLSGKKFTIVGGGEISGQYGENYYQRKIEKLQLESWIEVIPKANRDEMSKLMQNTDALISTSIAETFGVGICEAMLCGKPVITTLNGGVNEYISDDNSISIQIKNPIELANAICHFSAIKSTFNPEKIRTNIVAKYGKVAFRKRMDEIYLNAIENK